MEQSIIPMDLSSLGSGADLSEICGGEASISVLNDGSEPTDVRLQIFLYLSYGVPMLTNDDLKSRKNMFKEFKIDQEGKISSFIFKIFLMGFDYDE